MSKNLLISFIAVIGLISCGKQGIKTRSYYFPYASFTNQKIYKYVDAADSSKVLYWHFQTEVKNGDTLFSTGIYNSKFVLTSVFLNTITEDGVLLREMYINVSDSNILQKCEVKSGAVFEWNAKEKVPLFLSYSISNKDKTVSEDILTDRTFERKKEAVTFQGKEYQCLVVREKTLINHVNANTTKTDEQERNSFFAEGLGLIKFETYNSDVTSNVFNLQKILSLDEWKKLMPQPTDSLQSSSK
jgi:hypothetical protein